MSGDFETLEINQPKITYLKQDDNTEWIDKLIKNIEDMKNKLSRDSQSLNKKGAENYQPPKSLSKLFVRKYLEQFDL